MTEYTANELLVADLLALTQGDKKVFKTGKQGVQLPDTALLDVYPYFFIWGGSEEGAQSAFDKSSVHRIDLYIVNRDTQEIRGVQRRYELENLVLTAFYESQLVTISQYRIERNFVFSKISPFIPNYSKDFFNSRIELTFMMQGR